MQIFKSTKNTRPLPVEDFKYIRSDVPTSVTEEERLWLLSHGVSAVIDLRTERERAAKPCPLAADARFTYECYPLCVGDRIPASPDAVAPSYAAMVDDTFRALLHRLLTAETGVLYFCNAGKDRTGTVSAALLWELGTPREEIIADYMLSRDALWGMLSAYAAADPTVDLAVITPNEGYIGAFLDFLTHKKG